MLNGLGFLVLGTAFALAWERELSIALVFGGALLVNLVAAAAIGTAVPMVLQRLGQDPAVGSSVFLARDRRDRLLRLSGSRACSCSRRPACRLGHARGRRA
ncbi:MAG: magnesium transporter [Geminicoccaceae bacterium]